MTLGSELNRRLFQHLNRQPVLKCHMCKSTWLMSARRRAVHICTRCQAIAHRRHTLQTEIVALRCVEEADWQGEWPGELLVTFARHYGRTAKQLYAYVELDTMFDVRTFLAVDRHRLFGELDCD